MQKSFEAGSFQNVNTELFKINILLVQITVLNGTMIRSVEYVRTDS